MFFKFCGCLYLLFGTGSIIDTLFFSTHLFLPELCVGRICFFPSLSYYLHFSTHLHLVVVGHHSNRPIDSTSPLTKPTTFHTIISNIFLPLRRPKLIRFRTPPYLLRRQLHQLLLHALRCLSIPPILRKIIKTVIKFQKRAVSRLPKRFHFVFH